MGGEGKTPSLYALFTGGRERLGAAGQVLGTVRCVGETRPTQTRMPEEHWELRQHEKRKPQASTSMNPTSRLGAPTALVPRFEGRDQSEDEARFRPTGRETCVETAT
jgi:hypothetical protein